MDSQQTTNRKLGINGGHVFYDEAVKDKKYQLILNDSDKVGIVSGTHVLPDKRVLPHLRLGAGAPAMPQVDVLRLPEGIRKGLSV